MTIGEVIKVLSYVMRLRFVTNSTQDLSYCGGDGAGWSYVVLMKKYYHLHEEYLASLKK